MALRVTSLKSNVWRSFVFWLLSLASMVAVICVANLEYEVPLIWAYLGAASVFAFLLSSYDKFLAHWRRQRIPEVRLLFVALLGGTPGLLGSMLLFRHKVSDERFKFHLALVVLLQLMVLAVWTRS